MVGYGLPHASPVAVRVLGLPGPGGPARDKPLVVVVFAHVSDLGADGRQG